MRVRLVVGDGAEPRILAYRGAGPLRAWVAVAALRVALNAKRAASRAPGGGGGAADDDLLADVVDREPDPELQHLKTLYRAELREALAAALAQLADRPRALLRLRFVDGLELAHIGRLYRVHESTASRWVSQAVADVAADTRHRLVERLAIAPSAAARRGARATLAAPRARHRRYLFVIDDVSSSAPMARSTPTATATSSPASF